MQNLIHLFQRFTQIQSFAGILLFVATLIAMIWANSSLYHLYEQIRQFPIGFNLGDFGINKALILWVNDGLMAIFFFVIGLEIKRELFIGELNSPKKAAFPVFAAIGGMLFPMGIFILMTNSNETATGWGIPMATDIAFALAVIKILGDKVPIQLKIFLTAFAIVDDLGAVIIVALFYSQNIQVSYIVYALIPLILLSVFAYRGIYSRAFLYVSAPIVWFCFLKSGIHPTIAGVLLAFTIPIRQKIGGIHFVNQLQLIADKFKLNEDSNSLILSNTQLEQLDDLEEWTKKVQSPLQDLEHQLHGITAYFIMPVFALFNSGINFSEMQNPEINLILSISTALIIGKLIGILTMAWLAIKLKWAELPAHVNFSQLLGVALIAGLGFTMSIFIANLAYESKTIIDSAKLGIFIGSTIAAISGFLVLKFQFK